MFDWLTRFIGTQNERILRRHAPLVARIGELEAALEKLTDAQLRAKTDEFRARFEGGETLDALLPESFAVVREAMKRVLGKRHFDVQLLGGIVLHEGKIAEMKTGEGKTFVATLPSYLNALAGRGVHVVTVNDYLARRDAEWMGEIHNFLGLRVGCIVPSLNEAERREAYAADITYGTNNEFGFDYLRDNMKPSVELCVQRPLHYAIVDEVDSILIDEARTPLIISGPSEVDTGIYHVANQLVARLKKGNKADPRSDTKESGDYWVDEEHKTVSLTEAGVHSVERLLKVENLYDPQMLPVLHAVNQAVAAHALRKKDVDYVVQKGESGRAEVVIVDEFTGRLMSGRRWSDGLHQAVEAKEGISVQSESQTYASVTFQNYFRMYEKLAGMTGTADTEAPEFAKIYDLDVVVVPTNRPMRRTDEADVVFKSEREKMGAVIDEIEARHKQGQPVLVGTISIENSELLAKRLKKRGVAHNVLNAKQHAREAEIISQAGRLGAVTISTNMAGRGTDIVLGGNPEALALARAGADRRAPAYQEALREFEAQCAKEREAVLAAGGLHILGTERHESRRIDNQLRGRSGRQGDPGSSQFFLSLEDDLLRIFGGERIQGWMERLGLEEGEAIEHRMISRAIENAQKKVEARNFDIRKHLLDYDNVMNLQRRTFYGKRRELLALEDIHSEVLELVEGVLVEQLATLWPAKGAPLEDALPDLAAALHAQFGVEFDVSAPPFVQNGALAEGREELGRALLAQLLAVLEKKRGECDALAEQHSALGYPSFAELAREIMLAINDRQWKDHLHAMDGLRDSVGLRGYAQRDPKLEYQREAFGLFEEMNRRVDAEVAQVLFRVALPTVGANAPAPAPPAAQPGQAGATRETAGAGVIGGTAPAAPISGKVGRNAPCPCGSGRKYKKCHGAATA